MARQLGCDVWRHPGIEGDDIIGLYLQEGDVVVSGDKDMRTLAGAHLLPDGTIEMVSEFQANRKLYEQILTGDTSDGYKGCRSTARSQHARRWLIATPSRRCGRRCWSVI